MIKYLFLFLVLLCFGFFIFKYLTKSQGILELESVKDFKITPHLGAPLISISGLVMHSALVPNKITIERLNHHYVVYIDLILANKWIQKSGEFQYTIPIPHDDEELLFGEKKVQIWKGSRFSK